MHDSRLTPEQTLVDVFDANAVIAVELTTKQKKRLDTYVSALKDDDYDGFSTREEILTIDPDKLKHVIAFRKMKDEDEEARDAWRNEFVGVDDLESGGIKMLVAGLLPTGVNFFGARPGEGKTLLALSVAKALTTGKPLLGRFTIPVRMPVLYLIPESGGAAFRSRCEAFKITRNTDWFLCRTISEGAALPLSDPNIIAAVRHLKPLVILDTVVRFNSSGNENSAGENKVFADEVLALIANGAQGVLGLHHATKASRDEGLTLENALRGTNDFAAMADCVYGIERDHKLYNNGAGPLEFDISCLKPRDIEPPLPFRIAATERVSGEIKPRSLINRTHDLVIKTDEEVAKDINERFEDYIAQFSEETLDEVAAGLAVSKRKVLEASKALGYKKSRDGNWCKDEEQTSTDEDIFG